MSYTSTKTKKSVLYSKDGIIRAQNDSAYVYGKLAQKPIDECFNPAFASIQSGEFVGFTDLCGNPVIVKSYPQDDLRVYELYDPIPISTELKNALCSVNRTTMSVAGNMKTAARWLIDGDLSADNDNLDDRSEYFLITANACDRILRLADNVSIVCGKRDFSLHSAILFNVSDLCRSDAEISEYLVRDRGIKIYTDVPKTPVFLNAPDDMVEMIILNLLSNAIRFSPDNSRIDIQVIEEDKFITIAVHDRGRGLTEHHLLHAWESFMLTQEERGLFGGSGFGLAVVAKLAQTLGGCSVISSGGFGCSSIVRLPKRDTDGWVLNDPAAAKYVSAGANPVLTTLSDVIRPENYKILE